MQRLRSAPACRRPRRRPRRPGHRAHATHHAPVRSRPPAWRRPRPPVAGWSGAPGPRSGHAPVRSPPRSSPAPPMKGSTWTPHEPCSAGSFLRIALTAAALTPVAGGLASCAAGGGRARGQLGPDRRGLGGEPLRRGRRLHRRRGDLQRRLRHRLRHLRGGQAEGASTRTSTAKVSPSTQIAQELQPRFVGGNPPDLIDNSGANAIGISTIIDQLEDLTSVIDAPNLEGTKIRDTLYDGVVEPGTFDGKFAALNYVLTVYALWYSASLFEENGWTPPKTWDEAYELGTKAKAEGQVPLRLGQGGGHLLPDAGHRLGDQGGRRRGPAGAGEPGARLLVQAGRPVGVRGHEEDHRRRLLQAGRLGHAVHRRPGPVEQRPGRDPLPLGLVDRERDEGADQVAASR